MKTIDVNLGERSYPIWVESGLLERIPELLDISRHRKWVIITQHGIRDLFGEILVGSFESAGVDVTTLMMKEGEEAKSLSEVESIYHQLVAQNCDRSSMLVALGGGVVGDVTGFVAATFLRGIDYLQIPTTLLAMVDSAIGGKTGVNLSEGKNLVGIFHQPRGVVVDPDVTRFLPEREISSAMAEILKYGAIWDRQFFDELNLNMGSLLARKSGTFLTGAIARCCEIKADVVSGDEREGNLRRILNFGHTVGHALETTLGYGILRHGEAVAYGMIAAGQISLDLGYLSQEELEILEGAIRRLPLPELSKMDQKEVLAAVSRDKKVRDGKLHFVLLDGLGNAIISDKVTSRHIIQALEKL